MPITRTNWDRSLTWTPRRIARPTSESELVAVIRRARAEGHRVRVVGARHSWSEAAVSPDVEVSLDRLRQVRDIDPVNLRVVADAGIRIGRLVAALRRHGLALENVGSIIEQSLGGAVATGTHGTGRALGNLATQVTSLRLVTADGSVRELTPERDGARFRLAALCFGALGVVSRLTIRVVRAHRLRLHAYPLGFEETLARLPALLDEFPRAKLWWFPLTDRVWVHTWERVDAQAPLGGGSRIGRLVGRIRDGFETGPVVLALFYGLLRLGEARPAWIPGINRAIAGQYFRERVRVAWSEDALTIAMPPRHVETEAGVPIDETASALRALRKGIAEQRLPVSFVQEVRFVEADDLPLSPCYRRRSAMITGCSRAGVAGRADYFELFWRVMREHAGRPHWGKLLPHDASELRAAYPGLVEFEALRRELDPAGLFGSPFVARILDGQAPDGQAPDQQAPDQQAPDQQAPDQQAPGAGTTGRVRGEEYA